jgi:hypothetical protein
MAARTHPLASIGATALASFLMLACTSSSPSTPAAPPIAEADFAQRSAEAECDAVEGCCARVPYPYDRAACIAERRSEVEASMAQNRPYYPYDAANAGECVARERDVLASCTRADERKLAALLYYCGLVYTDGKRSESGICGDEDTCGHPGDRCSDFADCDGLSGPLYCEAKSATCKPQGNTGDSCDQTDACIRGLVCSPEHVCEPAPAAGRACANGTLCALDAFCDPASRTCIARKQTGEACIAGVDRCVAGDCAGGKCGAGAATSYFCAGTPPPTD